MNQRRSGNPDVGARIDRALKAANLDRNELARRAGRSRSWVDSVISGARGLNQDQIPQLAEILGVTSGWLLGDPDIDQEIAELGADWAEVWADLSPADKRRVLEEARQLQRWAKAKRREDEEREQRWIAERGARYSEGAGDDRSDRVARSS